MDKRYKQFTGKEMKKGIGYKKMESDSLIIKNAN